MTAPKKATRFDAMMRWMEHQWFPDAREWVCSRAVGETLEIAIGTGLNLRYYPDTVEITAIDQDRDMMALAEERAQATGLSLHAEVGDALALPFVDDAFDTVVCTFALCEVSDVDVALTEFVRVLRPSGRLLLADHIVATSGWVRGGQRVLEALTIPISGEHFTRRPLEHLAGVGLEVVESSRRTYGAVEYVHAAHPGFTGRR